jgi:hypothetical protein
MMRAVLFLEGRSMQNVSFADLDFRESKRTN